ncbi:hypothetical protein [Vibrio spartinae]|uniref:hypothetical protein n=1 Tax=Vibrio spartinae TaxID=1918945 RepID=UPI0013564835|nr:hypothetical protein [Vibrio spartinae]
MLHRLVELLTAFHLWFMGCGLTWLLLSVAAFAAIFLLYVDDDNSRCDDLAQNYGQIDIVERKFSQAM